MSYFCRYILKLLNEIACNIDYSLFLKNRLSLELYTETYKGTWKHSDTFETLPFRIH